MKKVTVVAAIIIHDEQILCVQRGESKLPYISRKYEFPGGKVEDGETLEETIIREIREELLMEIVPTDQFITVEHQYPDFHLTMYTFRCRCQTRDLKLTEHIDFKWLALDELEGLDWAAADIPIVNKLLEN